MPEGTVTLLFTDIEGSTQLVQDAGDGYVDLLFAHRRLLRSAFAAHGGHEVDVEGDGSLVAFASAREAIAAAQEAQEALAAYAWPEGLRVSVRMGLHTGEPTLHGGHYYGLDVHHAARVMGAAHGGQVLLSQATSEFARVPLRELGEHRLKDLSAPERLWQLGNGQFPRLRTLYQTNLPVQPSPLIGRRAEIDAVTASLRGDTRLLTLTGAGGSGKTRLALHAAAELADDFVDGVWFVPLAGVMDAALVGASIAQVLGARGALTDELRGKQLLLVLDNLEQVLSAANDVAEIVASAADVRVLATSRERLAVAAEREYVVPTLPQAEGVVLFTERARRHQPEFEPGAAVIEIVERLDGLPLALELAAARVKVLTTEQIAERLNLDVLGSNTRDAPPRQRTLRATIDWSYELLTSHEQRLLRRLSAFTGGWTLQAAEAVAEADIHTLGSLVDKSLIWRQEQRFTMLETIRQFAQEQHNDDADTKELQQRHAKYFLSIAEQAAPELEGADQARWLEELDAEHENLRTATEWANQSADQLLELRLVSALWWFWYMRGHWQEGRRALERTLAAPDQVDLRLRARALGGAAWFAQRQGDKSAWRKAAEEGLRLAREIGDTKTTGRALRSLATLASVEGEKERAESLFEESAAISSSIGDTWNLAIVIHNLGDDAREVGDFSRAVELLEQSVSIAREGGELRNVAYFLIDLGQAELSLGERVRARAHIKQGVAVAQELKFIEAMASGVEALAAVCAATNQPLEAATLLTAALEAQATSRVALDPPELELREITQTAIAAALDSPTLEVAFETGRTMTLDQAVDYALRV